MFWLSAPALVSEREPHCVLERAQRYNAVLREVLQPRGWIEVMRVRCVNVNDSVM